MAIIPEPDARERLGRLPGWTLTGPAIRRQYAFPGFIDAVAFVGYGESEVPELRGLEQHPRDPDTPELPHVLVVEARRGELDEARHERLLAAAREHLLDHLRG